jgi:hypothetical protein
MPKRALLLRLLLSLALVLNGTVPAMAAVRMQLAAGAEATSAPHAQAPCHDGGAMAASSGMDHGAATPPTEKSPQKAPDCCKGGCTCACMQPAQAPPPAGMLPMTAAAPTPGVRRLVLGHANPALPHLIRPPIG